MGSYARAVWDCRFFWLALVRNDLRTRYRRSVLGMGWSLLHPIAMTAILCTMFSRILDVSIEELAPSMLAGLACWNYILACALQGCQCFFFGEAYIRQYPAPLAIYPLRTTLGAAIHFLLALAVVIGLTWFLHGFGNVPALVCLVPALLLFLVLGWSLAVLGGFANVSFSDTQHLAEVAFQLLFYATPIIYTESTLQQKSMGWLLQYNPFVVLLQIVREPILKGRPPSWDTFGTAAAIVAVVAASAVLTLVRSQRRLIFYL